MNEYLLRTLRTIAGLIALVFCMWLVIDGQRTISYPALGQMMVGVLGIVLLLYLYNRRFAHSPDKRKKEMLPEDDQQ